MIRACHACPDGQMWSREGPTGRTCPVCKGRAIMDWDDNDIQRAREALADAAFDAWWANPDDKRGRVISDYMKDQAADRVWSLLRGGDYYTAAVKDMTTGALAYAAELVDESDALDWLNAEREEALA